MADDHPNTEPDTMEQLCWAYLDGTLDEQEVDRFVRLLVVNKDLRQELRRKLMLHDALRVTALRGWDF